jgi:hypothetical protein
MPQKVLNEYDVMALSDTVKRKEPLDAAHWDKSNEKKIFNFHSRGSVLTRKLDFVYLTLNQGGKIFSEDTVNVESLISLRQIFIANFIDFKKWVVSSALSYGTLFDFLRQRVLSTRYIARASEAGSIDSGG